MPNKNLASGIAIGLVIGAAIGLTVGLLYAPRQGQETRHILRQQAQEALKPVRKLLFRLRWLAMSPRERYVYLSARGGSLREWRRQYETPKHANKGGQPI